MGLNEADFGVFGGDYMKFEPDQQYDIVVANWKISKHKFKEGEAEKNVLEMDVLKVNGVEHAAKPLIFRTSSFSFVDQVKRPILDAQARGQSALRLLVKFGRDKKYSVMVPQ